MAIWNPWRGCHKQSEGCKYCYIHKGDYKRGIDTNNIVKTKNFYAPIAKNKSGAYKMKSGQLVYLGFSTDFLIEDADDWRKECWSMIQERSDLQFFFLTKRIERFMDCIPDDWNGGYENVTVGCTVENQDRADYRLSIFKELPIKHKNIICQPLIENWGTPGPHAYLSYQTSSWDYRDSYKPLKDLGKDSHSWEYIQAAGSEVKAADTKVTDVQMSKDGEYRIAIEGIDLSAANSFNTLSIATDINKAAYPGITITDTVLKVDGETVTDKPVTPVADQDNDYYKFLLINKWSEDQYPLTEMSNKEAVKIPAKNIEITFKITGLQKILDDLASGEYVNPETGSKVSGTGTNTTKPEDSKLEKGSVFTSGSFQYKVTKKASGSSFGTVTVTGLTKKGLSAKKLNVNATVKDNAGTGYTVTAIGKKAFAGAKAKGITLNKYIKKIPALAFQNCKKLNTLTLKAKLSKAANDSFKGCKNTISVKGVSSKANKKLLNKTNYKNFK